MVHNNKVLTVSYGTFSCTLEGFDDSFGTMKAIAEYFRDLASDDRYFGAEPPQPDVDMLARIAQKEIARQVEAHSTDTGAIVLRAAETETVADAVAPAVATESAPEPAPKPKPVPVMVSEPVIEPEVTPEVAETPAEKPAEKVEVAEVIVADAKPAEPVASQPEPSPETVVSADPVEEIAGVEDPVEVVAEVAPEVVAEAAPEVVVKDKAPEAPAADSKPEPLIELVADAAEAPAQADPVVEIVSPTKPAPAADSIAAKLQRIRAVVSQNDAFDETEDYIEDQDASVFADQAAVGTTQSSDADEDIQTSDDSQDADDEVLNVLNQLDSSHSDDDASDGDELDDVTATDAPEVDTDDSADEPADEPIAYDNVLFDDLDAEADATAKVDLGEDGLVDDEIANILADDAQDDEAREIEHEVSPARVVKVKRADLEAAIASGGLTEVDEPQNDDFAGDPVAQDDSSLSPEDEADLMRELAAVEGELDVAEDTDLSDSGTPDNFFDQAETPEQDTDQDYDEDYDATPHRNLSQPVSEDEADLSRLMAEADEKLEDPETSSSRETYSHLRAAVAAAEAERSATGLIGDQTQDEAYRDDLADVVRPRRAAIEGRRTSRLNDSRPAPLKLVAEQRVDGGEGIAQRGPVRPRRVMTVPVVEAGPSDVTGSDAAFAEFATRMEATELPDLLEAAAAYLSFVEGHEKFSRPQLMSKVRLIKQDDYNREDGLRSFGQLLRDGKIEKRGGGRFAASADIGFRPDEPEVEAEVG